MAPKCGICLSYSSSIDLDYFVNTLCGHLYHYQCIRSWINEESSPKFKIDFSSIVKLHGLSPVLNSGIEGNEVYNIKLTLLGDSGTGKTSMMNSFTQGEFRPSSATRGVDMGFKTLQFAGKRIKLTVQDCAGQERFRAICPSYIRNSHGIIIVYDITEHTTFDHIEDWLQVIYESAPPDVSILLAGNKCDLEEYRQITTDTGRLAAKSLGFEFMETSAKNVVNLEASFRALVAKIISSMWDEGYIDSFEISPPVVKLSQDNSITAEPQQSSVCSC